MLWAIVIAMNPKKKERTVKGDWCGLAKDPSKLTMREWNLLIL